MDRNAQVIRDWEDRYCDPDNDDFYNGYHQAFGYPDECDDCDDEEEDEEEND